jgi:HD-GYP domain-containing protein (c-di-GMP phosphodiesterase class II)
VYLGIRFKLSLLTCLLVTAVIIVSSTIVMEIMDTFLLGELVKRGLSLSRGAANAAGYSMLVRDRLSLDNLVAKIKERQEDINYVAVIDHRGMVAAHSELLKSGSNFQPETGVAIHKDSDGAVATQVTRNGQLSYEFRTPIIFTGKEIGQLYLGIDSAALTSAQAAARRKVAVMAVIVLLLSVAGTCYIARIFTRPIKQLNEGVFQLKSGSNLRTVAVTQRDELGELARNFNEMAGVILTQKDMLAEYARGLEESYFATVKILATSIDARDDYTMQHSTRVATLSLLVAEELGLGAEEQRDLEVAALVHDLGKIRIPDHILKKADALDDDEFHRVKRHPRDGADILSYSQSLRRFMPAVLHHHEWYNGQGYPAGLKGEEIPLFAAIIALADSYDAMTSSRPYRAGLPAEYAIGEIIRCRGTQFDPHLADCFVAAVRRRSLDPSVLTVLEMPVYGAPLLEGTT